MRSYPFISGRALDTLVEKNEPRSSEINELVQLAMALETRDLRYLLETAERLNGH